MLDGHGRHGQNDSPIHMVHETARVSNLSFVESILSACGVLAAEDVGWDGIGSAWEGVRRSYDTFDSLSWMR